MKRSDISNEGPRFQAQVRHYHRAGAKQDTSWEDWVDGEDGVPSGRLWAKIVIALAVLMALGALVLGFLRGGFI